MSVLEELKNEIGDAARIAKIDVDQHEELAARYRIQAVPDASPCTGHTRLQRNQLKRAFLIVSILQTFP